MPIGRTLTGLLTARTAALPVAVCRIGLGTAALGRAIKSCRDLYLLQHDPEVVPARVFTWTPALDTLPEMALVGGLSLLSAVGLIVGYRARLSALVHTACIALLYVMDQNFWGHHMYFIGLMTFLIAFTESDAALSVHSRRGSGESDVLYWPVFLMKVQLSLAYFYTSVAKLNPVFLSGEVIAARATLPDALTGPGIFAGLAIATVAAEFCLSFALWVPRLRLWGALVGIAVHGLVPVLFGFYAGLVVFTLATLSVYILFVDADDLAAIHGRFPKLAVRAPA